MSKKQITRLLDTVETFLVAQGKPAINVEGNCQYFSPLGLKCGVGCLIPEDKYSIDFESKVIEHGDLKPVVALIAEEYKLSQKQTLSILSDIQDIHDSNNILDNGFFDLEELEEAFTCLRGRLLGS